MQKGKGFVYILTNASFASDVLKIGMTRRSAKIRAGELYDNATGIPEPFEIAHKVKVANCVAAEEIIHKHLKNYRINKSREFFKISLPKAIIIVTKIANEVNNLYSRTPLDKNDNDESMPDTNSLCNTEIIDEQINQSVPHYKTVKKGINQTIDAEILEIDIIHKVRSSRIVSVQRIELKCRECKKKFRVTVARYETIAACPQCGCSNKVSLSWD